VVDENGTRRAGYGNPPIDGDIPALRAESVRGSHDHPHATHRARPGFRSWSSSCSSIQRDPDAIEPRARLVSSPVWVAGR